MIETIAFWPGFTDAAPGVHGALIIECNPIMRI
jgi:hypothetical protein